MKQSKKYLWLACDRDNTLVLFPDKPFRDKWFGFWCKFKDGIYCCNDELTVREYESRRFVKVTLSLEPEVIASDENNNNITDL